MWRIFLLCSIYEYVHTYTFNNCILILYTCSHRANLRRLHDIHFAYILSALSTLAMHRRWAPKSWEGWSEETLEIALSMPLFFFVHAGLTIALASAVFFWCTGLTHAHVFCHQFYVPRDGDLLAVAQEIACHNMSQYVVFFLLAGCPCEAQDSLAWRASTTCQ